LKEQFNSKMALRDASNEHGETSRVGEHVLCKAHLG